MIKSKQLGFLMSIKPFNLLRVYKTSTWFVVQRGYKNNKLQVLKRIRNNGLTNLKRKLTNILK